MRHLSVPSTKTASVREYLSNNGWLEKECGIQNLGDLRAIPLTDNAPEQIQEYSQIELEPLVPGPKHWTERLDPDLFIKFEEFWPSSYDQIGDIVILKLTEQIEVYSKEIGNAFLEQFANVRVVCADKGVKGEFRVRDLTIIASRGNPSLQTIVKENGNHIIVNPSLAYYSPRLATERISTLESAKQLKNRLGRPLDVCDPYAGIGPTLVTLLSAEGLVNEVIANDLNPEAVTILKKNIPNHHWIGCQDARNLAKEHPSCADMLLVNLPHDSLVHLPDLIGLLKKNQEVIIRGWAIIDNSSVIETKAYLESIFDKAQINRITITPAKSYSPLESYSSFEISMILP